MKASWSLAAATGTLAIAAGALYACSSDSGGGTTTNPEAGTDTGIPAEGGTDTGTDSPPGACAIFTQDGGNAPNLSPQACNDCVQQKCCTQVTKCYGANVADGGFDGSDGKKTNCQLYGECEGDCTAGDIVCSAQCESDYGTSASQDWAAADGCQYGAAPAGCQTFCQ